MPTLEFRVVMHVVIGVEKDRCLILVVDSLQSGAFYSKRSQKRYYEVSENHELSKTR